MTDLIKREDAIKAIDETPFIRRPILPHYIKAKIKDIPSAEPWDIYNLDEWCTDCKEYDTENHRCPRWNKMIRRTIEENKVVNCCGCVHWVNDVANPDRMICKELKIPTEDFFFCGWGEREGADNERL
jgi:hypothetical protein